MEVSGQFHTLAALPPGYYPPVQLYRSGLQLWSRETFLASNGNFTMVVVILGHSASSHVVMPAELARLFPEGRS